ncbi:acyl-CoA thioesterase II [Colletotrichum navitas]|uniref:Acyl-CoA thioesterase II n=1 Tax=Colletotrichum navitas TaxID=681940 RepID=A0AAD8V8M1_9PEZI|nr:acyl-CoA thioesterase II [Colletotrichum navitas]KAK1597064.1 acyl-CoA thioesterase II [Colletotrichum navitas]
MTDSAMAATLREQVAVDDLGSDQFVSRANPARMGNAANIAYGGCTIGVGVQAACSTVPAHYLLYSTTGNYLGPALTDRKLKCSVRRVRDTRTFATRLVEISQDQDYGKSRLCMIMLADFQVKEEKSLFVYSAPPSMPYSSPEECPAVEERTKDLVRRGIVTEKEVKLYMASFGLNERFLETRGVPETVGPNNLLGIAKKAKTPQDDLHLTSKTSADWFRCRHPIGRLQDRLAGLAFILDGAVSFVPLTHSNKFLDDAGPCSSLDFALRFFTGDVDLAKWHIREMKTITGNDGRTYTEARLWDREGNMVAIMNQQSIMRPPKGLARASL